MKEFFLVSFLFLTFDNSDTKIVYIFYCSKKNKKKLQITCHARQRENKLVFDREYLSLRAL
jgi:hypothetical protein